VHFPTETSLDLSELYSSYVVGIDLETTGLDPHTDSITAVVIAYQDQAHMLPPERGLTILSLLPLSTRLVFHNFKFDARFLRRAGFDPLRYKLSDTMLMHHLVDENEQHSLDSIVKARWGDDYKERFWTKYAKFEGAPVDEQREYACKDGLYTLELYHELNRELTVRMIPPSLVEHVHRLAFALFESECYGVAVDLDYLTAIGVKLKGEMERLKLDMRKLCDIPCESIELDLWANELSKRKTEKGRANVEKPEFNWDSSTQLKALFYYKLGLPIQKSQKTKEITTDDGALTALAKSHPVVPLIQEYRGHSKIYTAFIEGTLEKMHEGRIYPSFNVNGTVTGRISSSNPNMQQLPRDGDIRGIYVPDAGHLFVTCDYSQLEICLAAHFSDDPVLLQLIHDGRSMHDHTAAECGISRQAAKTVNFLTIYGGTEFRLSVVLGISFQEAGAILKKLWRAYRGLKSAIEACHAKVEAGEAIVNPFGRRRQFPEGLTGKELERAKRQAFNALVQGTGADLTHGAFYTTAENMLANGWGRAMFEVHDEIVNMPKREFVVDSSQMLKEVMVSQGKKIGLKVPLTVECSEGLTRWQK
jgi:DNA polymerase-1